jgi:hypothetical protein
MKRNVILCVLVIAAFGVLYALNQKMDAPSTPTAASPAAAAPKKSAPPAKAVLDATDPVPPEITVGDPNMAKVRVSVGWDYDAVNEADKSALVDAVSALRDAAVKSNGAISLEIVDLDTPSTELSPAAAGVSAIGLTIQGPPADQAAGHTMDLTANLGEGDLTSKNLSALMARLV